MRSAGILLPVSALPSPWGIGTFGQTARDFVDFLYEGGQSYWQILPVCPTGYGDSPYQSVSSYAGNPYYIDLDELHEKGLLPKEAYQDLSWGEDPARVDYGRLYKQRFKVLRTAAARARKLYTDELEAFCRQESEWLEDYALFMALKDDNSGNAWSLWPDPLKRREEEALEEARERLSEDLWFWRTVQYLFYSQWGELKRYANDRGIEIIGDLPIYVSLDSADVWAEPDVFQLDEDLRPVAVAGCPPDGFSDIGQLWGNPLFRWEKLKEEGYAWWFRRIAFQFRIYDVLRIDHFRGFESYYAIPFGETTARNGAWEPGPGFDFFKTLKEKMGDLPIIAEDLGFLTPEVLMLLQKTGFPGMKVLEFAFDSRDSNANYLPYAYPRECVVYTGTHDNDTIQGWMKTAPRQDVEKAIRYLRLTEDEGYHWGMMRCAWGSVADLAVMQMQDLLGLGSEARFNTPSTLGHNWVWRALPDDINPALAAKLREETELYGRLKQAVTAVS